VELALPSPEGGEAGSLTCAYPSSGYSYPNGPHVAENVRRGGKGMKMHMPGLAKEYERTCDDCGHVWRVTKAIAHPHMQGLPGMLRGANASPQATNAVVSANAELAERAAASRRGPKCESDHYQQRSIRS